MNVQLQIGGVLGGGGEATHYFIVCEHNLLFNLNLDFFLLYSLCISGQPQCKLLFWNSQIQTKKNCRLFGICVRH